MAEENEDSETLLQSLKSKIGVVIPSSFTSDVDQTGKSITVVTVFGKLDQSSIAIALKAVSSASSLDPFQIGEALADVIFEHRKIHQDEKEAFNRLPNVEAVFLAEKSTLVLVLGLPVSFYQLSAASTGKVRQEEIDCFRLMTVLFSLSHILVCVDPGANLSLRHVTIFKAIWQASQKTSSLRSETLKKLRVFPNNVVSSARLAVPRLLFVFDCRRYNFANTQGSESVSKKIRDLRHSLEDQTYRILRQAHIVHPNSAQKGLVSIPSSEEFITIICHTEAAQNDGLSSANAMLMQLITGPVTKTAALTASKSAMPPIMSNQPQQKPGANLNSFQRTRDFVFRYVEQLQTDNIRANQTQNSPFLCSLSDWMRAFLGLDKALSQSQALVRSLDRYLFVNCSFAETLGKQALDSAKTLYADGLPRYYSAQIHEERLAAAKEHFFNRARNSGSADYYLRHLENYCNGVFSVERRLCERISIFGSVCTLPLHRTPGDPCLSEEDEKLPVRAHACNILSKAACNCGKIQKERDDPFTSAEANYEFYHQLEDECCHGLLHYPLVATEPKSKPKPKAKPKQQTESSMSEATSPLSEIENAAEESANDEEPTQTSPALVMSPKSAVTRATPSFWSLLSLGNFAVYNMNRGLGDYAGFVSGTHYLYPIGMGPSGEVVNVSKPGPANKAASASSTPNTRIMAPAIVAYLGVEYECPRGHRFLIETPDKAQRVPLNQSANSPSNTRGGRNVPAEPPVPPALCLSDVPLFFGCVQCPTKAPSSGQLMRIFVLVPPQSPSSVGIALAVRVQASQAFVFSPLQPDGADEIDDTEIALAPNNLWVLRFPLVYVNKNSHIVDDQEMPILPVDHADYANFRLHRNFLRFHPPSD